MSTETTYEQGNFPIHDAERLEEHLVDDFMVIRGLTDALCEQLVEKSQQDHVAKATPRDYQERFLSVDSVRSREVDTDYYALYKNGDLAGVIWFSKRPRPDSDYTYAIRLYEGYQGRGLGPVFSETAIDDFGHLHPNERSIWLGVDQDNDRARKLYEKTGWQRTIAEGSREIMTKVLDAKKS